MLGDLFELLKCHNGINVVVQKVHDTFVVSTATDCHLVENEPDRALGHSMQEKIMVRFHRGAFEVISYTPVSGINDLSDLVIDQHVHSSMVRSVLPKPTLRRDSSELIPDNNKDQELVLMGDKVLTRGEKALARAERKRENKARRDRGEKPARWRPPKRFQGMTTQEYHEARTRETEELSEWVDSQGMRAHPQPVREWLKSPGGSQQWNDLHNYAVSRPDFAQSQLAKLNSFLRATCGLKIDLHLNENRIQAMRAKINQANMNRQKQLEASGSRTLETMRGTSTKGQVARAGLEEAYRESARNFTWADDMDDGLPDLPSF